MELVETVQVKCKYLIRIVKIEKKKKKENHAAEYF